MACILSVWRVRAVGLAVGVPSCFPRVLWSFWRSVRVARLFRSVALSLQRSTMGQIPRVLRFLPSVRVLGRVWTFAALVG